MMSSLRIRAEISDRIIDAYTNNKSSFKFVYVIESPSMKTINELVHALEKYADQHYLNSNHTKIVHLTTHDGFILSKYDLCSNVLKDNDHIICIDMRTYLHSHLAEINCDEYFFELKQHDAIDDTEKFIRIGLDSYSKLFVYMFGTDDQIFLRFFTIHELIEIAQMKNKDSVIARLDTNLDWFLETKWQYDLVSNKNLSVICSLKVGSSDGIWSNKLPIEIDTNSMSIRKGEIEYLSGETGDNQLSEEKYQHIRELISRLPSATYTGSRIHINPNENIKLNRYECDGDSSIRMTYGNTNAVNIFQDSHSQREGVVQQIFIITHIIFSKKPSVLPEILNQKRSTPAEKPVSVANLAVSYQTEEGAWRECQDIAIAQTTVRDEQPKWLTDSVINIEPDKLVSFMIRGCILVNGEIGSNNQARNRAHKNLPQPLKLKIVVIDNFSRQSSLIVEQLNKPLELIDRESFIKSYNRTIEELLAFVYADDCDIEERVYVSIYIDKESSLVIKNTTPYTSYFGRKTMHTWEFNAKKNKTIEMNIDQVQYKSSTHESKVIALFDPETYIFYALRVEITTSTSRAESSVVIPKEKIK